MAKKFLFGFLVLNLATLVSGCGMSSKQPNEPPGEVSSQQEAANENQTDEETNKITVSENSIWSQQECNEAVNLAEIVIDAVKNKDLNTLSKLISYPITIASTSREESTIKSEGEFLRLRFDDIFTDKMCSEIINTQELFSSWRGFMLGRGEMWLAPVQNQIKIISVNKI